MHGFLDAFLVGGVLLASVVYALFSLGPRSLRRMGLLGFAALLRVLPERLGLRGVSLRLETSAAAKSQAACGGCEDCSSGQPKRVATPAAEIHVPVSRIGKR